MKLSERLLQAWYQGHPVLAVLWPLEQLYRFIVQRKRKQFVQGITASYRAPVPVIVVGNITVGGTGKTPLILWLIEQCRAQGLSVGVVSRGYGAQPDRFPWTVSATDTAEQAGDEPLLIVQRTAVPLVIAPRRAQAVQKLLAEHPVDIILSDDGLQHYALARDLELVLIDAARGLGNQRCLPMGPLREPATRLATVDAVLVNGAQQDSEQGYAMHLQPTGLVHVRSGRREPLNFFPAAQKMHAVAGIGNPQRFFKTLEGLNWKPIAHAFADHAEFSPQDLEFADDLPVLMTEKDAVKCRAFAADNCWYLQVAAQPSPAFARWLGHRLQNLLTESL
ncbi:tetraacyldisaccharide 4'-kinase [Denitrificimonas sp. JX-1]|uniref:Tetraacyldisaccharide 4'-kinase n=1 Tax=Denitrificimonas halotolerans TaxID=3098930 RepID=A0ABU5GM99_9GAMM|nr:tetraacyldisaccharide 4'-kinase [Denitrificimonas sp. JX-1]MDY7218000.1 tetraacyldisaccharide 4'-kinase [Denitrificimonas sp. JX-1]